MDPSRLPVALREVLPSTAGTLHQYELLKVLGQGGMGIVVHAKDTKLGRVVALKFMKPELARSPSARKMFLSEARAMAALEHGNIIRVYEVGEVQSVPYLAMEYLNGESLDRLLQRGFPFTMRQLVRIGYQVASGLQAAHAAGIVHRDVKPANVILELPRGNVKVLDFGLARSSQPFDKDINAGLGGEPESSGRVGSRGGISDAILVGTPGYLSPEQATDQSVDARSDLYSLGVMLFQLASGRLPIQADADAGSHIRADALVKLLTERPPSMSHVCPDAPETFTLLVDQCLERDPRKRPQTAREVCERLDEIYAQLEDTAGTAETIELVVEPRRSLKRPTRKFSRMRLAAIGSVAVVTLIGILSWALRVRDDESPRIRASEPIERKDAEKPIVVERIETRTSAGLLSRSPKSADPITMDDPDTNVPDALRSSVLIRASTGEGVDTYVEEGSRLDFSEERAIKVSRQKPSDSTPRRHAFLRFDLTNVEGRQPQVIDAYLLLTYQKQFRSEVPEFKVAVHVLRDDSPDANWEPSGQNRIRFDSNPVAVPKIDLVPAGTASGRFSAWNTSKTKTLIQHRNNNLTKQIQKDTDALLTLVITPEYTNNREAVFVSSEGSESLSPCLAIVMEPDPAAAKEQP